MAKKDRLSQADFARFEGAKSRRVHGTLFSLSVFALPPGRTSAFACIVSKRTANKASERNLIKRRCREAVRVHAKRISRPVALVLHAKKGATGAAFRAVENEVRSLIDKIADTGYNKSQ